MRRLADMPAQPPVVLVPTLAGIAGRPLRPLHIRGHKRRPSHEQCQHAEAAASLSLPIQMRTLFTEKTKQGVLGSSMPVLGVN